MEKKLTNAELQKQVEELKALIKNAGISAPIAPAPVVIADEYVEFQSLSLVPMYLTTDNVKTGKGDVYTFEKFGEIVDIPMVDAKGIIRHNKEFVREGLVYIRDEDFVAKEHLKQHYKNMLDADGLAELVDADKETFGKDFPKLTKTQQDTICGLIYDKLKNKEKVNDEVLYYINHYLGRDLKEEATDFQLLIDNEEK